jgi:hypothetical protein
MNMGLKPFRASTLVLAGLAGGMAEVVWVALYCAVAPLAGTDVAGAIALAVRAGFVGDAWLGATGLAVHFTLSLAVAFAAGAALARALRGGLAVAAIVPVAALALLAIWTFNFFVLLPALAPAFVALLPLGVTAGSKLLFGLAMGVVLRQALRQPRRAAARALAHA